MKNISMLTLIFWLCLISFVYANYDAEPVSTIEGGGTWGPILEFAVQINNSEGAFTCHKQSGEFLEEGTMYLKVGTYEVYGVNHCIDSISSGDIESVCLDNFEEYPSDTYPKEYYCRIENNKGVAWAGPIIINNAQNNPCGSSFVMSSSTNVLEKVSILAGLVIFMILIRRNN